MFQSLEFPEGHFPAILSLLPAAPRPPQPPPWGPNPSWRPAPPTASSGDMDTGLRQPTHCILGVSIRCWSSALRLFTPAYSESVPSTSRGCPRLLKCCCLGSGLSSCRAVPHPLPRSPSWVESLRRQTQQASRVNKLLSRCGYRLGPSPADAWAPRGRPSRAPPCQSCPPARAGAVTSLRLLTWEGCAEVPALLGTAGVAEPGGWSLRMGHAGTRHPCVRSLARLEVQPAAPFPSGLPTAQKQASTHEM